MAKKNQVEAQELLPNQSRVESQPMESQPLERQPLELQVPKSPLVLTPELLPVITPELPTGDVLQVSAPEASEESQTGGVPQEVISKSDISAAKAKAEIEKNKSDSNARAAQKNVVSTEPIYKTAE